MPRVQRLLACLAALMGAAGVALAAAAQHTGGDELARTAALFLILHAGALVAVSAHSMTRCLAVGGFLMAVGAILFALDLGSRAFLQARLFPFAAPIGGTLMIAAWVTLAVAFALASPTRFSR